MAKRNLKNIPQENSEVSNQTKIDKVSCDEYFTFFEHAPIALWIEDFSEAKKYMDSLVKKYNTDLKTYINNNPTIIPKLASLVAIKDVNATAVKLYKAKNKEELYENLNKVFTKKSNEGFSKLVVDILLGTKETEIESVNKTLVGEEFDILIKFNVVDGNENTLENVIVSVENITERVRTRKELANSEKRYKESESIAKIGSWFYDFETNEISWTDEAYKIIEVNPQESKISLEYYLSFVHNEDKHIVNNFDVKNLLKNPDQNLKYRIFTKSGKLKYIHEKRSIIIENDKISRIIGIGQDVTENVIFEQKLNTTKNLLSNTLSSIKDGFVILDKNSRYLYVNEKAAKLLGKSAKSLIGKQIWKEFPEKEGDLFYDEYQNTLRTKKPKSFENYFAPWDKWFENRMIPSKDEMLIFFQEITDKKLSENKIKEAYNIINKSTSVAIRCKNERDFPVVFASENTKNLFGYSYKDLLASKVKIHETVYFEDLPKIRSVVFKLAKSKTSKSFKPKPFRIITKKGKIKWVEGSFYSSVNENGIVTHIHGIVEDITEQKNIEDLLFKSNQRLKYQFNNTPLASIIWDLDFKILDWNKSAERIFGYKASEVVGKINADLLTPPYLMEEMKKLRETSFVEDRTFRNTNENITKNGDIIICDWYSVTLKDSQNKRIGSACLIDDITERVNSKILLEKSEKKYRDIFEKSVDAVMILKEGLFVDCNESTLRIFGYNSKEDLLKLHPSQISPKEQPEGDNSFQKAEDVMKIALENGSNRFRWYHKRKNGQVFPAEVSLTKIEEYNNKPTIHAVVKDITERVKKETLEGVLYNISKAALTIEDFNEFSIFIKNELHKIIDTTNFYIALYNKDNDIISLPYVVDEKDDTIEFPAKQSLTGHVIKSKRPLLVNEEYHKKLIKSGIIEMVGKPTKIWAGAPLKIQNEVFGAIVVQSYRDEKAYNFNDLQLLEFVANQISVSIQNKNAENELKNALIKAQESDRLKSAFLANMSHEIRTPMNGIIGFSELFLDTNLSESERKDYAKIVINSSNQLLSIVNDILDISKIEAGVVQLNYSNVNVNQLLDSLCAFYTPITKESRLALTCVKGLSDNDCMIKIDKTKLHQILTNLLSNALKFTEKGSIELGYQLKNQNLEFYVKDTGIGIDKKLHTKIFDRFIQADLDLNKQKKGTGLGLAISKKFIELFKGEMWLESDNRGTKVFFTVPYNQVKKPIINTVIEKEIKKITNNSNKEITLLIAEDEEYNMLYIKELFSATDYKIIEAVNGIEAVNFALKNPEIDMVFMDIKMPQMNGNEAMVEIKKIKPTLPIIALSAFAMESDKENALNKGFDAYLTKPIDRKKLFKLIHQFSN